MSTDYQTQAGRYWPNPLRHERTDAKDFPDADAARANSIEKMRSASKSEPQDKPSTDRAARFDSAPSVAAADGAAESLGRVEAWPDAEEARDRARSKLARCSTII